MNSSKARPSGRCNVWQPVRPPRRHAALCAAILACVTGSAALAQQGPQLTVNYREADIRMVTEQVQAVIGRPIIIDPRVRAQVTVLSNAPMSPDAFYRTFLSMLEVHGFVALDSGNAIQIVPDANARFGAGDDYVTQAIVLDNIGAAQLVPILRPLLPQSAHLAAHQPSNALIVADRPQNMRRMLDLIRRMDQAGTQEVEVIGLENAAADDVVRMLGQLNQAAQAAGGAPPIQVIADARTNSVLLAGVGHHPPADAGADRASRHALGPGRRHVGALPELRRRRGSRDQAASAVRRRRRRAVPRRRPRAVVLRPLAAP